MNRNSITKHIISICAVMVFVSPVVAADAAGEAAASMPSTLPSHSPAILPGKGLAQHPFLYAGEWDNRKQTQSIFVVRDGKIAWSYEIPINAPNGTLQEFSDATMLSNGNILLSRKTGAGEVTPDKRLIWNYDAPANTEIHVVQPLGTNRVLFVQNGKSVQLLKAAPDKQVAWALRTWDSPADLTTASTI